MILTCLYYNDVVFPKVCEPINILWRHSVEVSANKQSCIGDSGSQLRVSLDRQSRSNSWAAILGLRLTFRKNLISACFCSQVICQFRSLIPKPRKVKLSGYQV